MTVSRRIEAPAADVWSVFVDTRRWPEWGPSVRSASIDGGGHVIGPDSTGTVTTLGGLRLAFRITEWEAGRRWSWDVARLPATGHAVRSLGETTSEASFEVPWFAAPYAAVCRIALDRIADATRP